MKCVFLHLNIENSKLPTAANKKQLAMEGIELGTSCLNGKNDDH